MVPRCVGRVANVTVILSDDRVSSPVLQSFDTAILLNQQSLDKFESMVKPGGLMIYDPNGITRHPERDDLRIFQVENSRPEAARMKSPITFNMLVLGAYIKVNPVVDFENVIKGLKKSLSPAPSPPDSQKRSRHYKGNGNCKGGQTYFVILDSLLF